MMNRLVRIAKAIFRAAASENKQQFLAQKYVVPLEIISQLDRIDPSRGKYLEWMVRRVEENNIRWPEDSTRVHQALQDFQALTQKKHTREQYKINPDINTYTLHDIEDFGDRLHGREQTPESMAEAPEGAEKVYDDGVYALAKVTDPDTACSLALGTKWCTSNWKVARDYLEEGPLYVIYKGGQKVGQTDGVQVMDLQDRSIDLFKDPGLLKVLMEAGLILEFDRVVEQHEGPGSDEPMDWLNILEETGLMDVITKNPMLAVEFASTRSFEDEYSGAKRRFREAEPYIMKHPMAAARYAQVILRQRWPEAESVIAQAPEAKRLYEQTVLHQPMHSLADAGVPR